MDNQEIRAIYSFIFDRVKELHPNLQVIIVDHADINEKYFQEAVVEKWWDGASLYLLIGDVLKGCGIQSVLMRTRRNYTAYDRNDYSKLGKNKRGLL